MTSHLAVPLANANIAAMLWSTTGAVGEREAIVERDRVTTYPELLARSAAFAAALEQAGVRPGDRVAVFLERTPDAAAAFFGIVAMGAIAVNVNETLRPRQVEHILNHCRAAAMITTPELLQRQPRSLVAHARIIHASDVPARGLFMPVSRTASDFAQIIYTSGSTGLPKGVSVMHGNLWSGMAAVTSYVGVTGEDRLASLLPFSFDYGFNQLLCAVGMGAALVIERSPIPQQIAATLAAQGVTVLPCVPPLWLQLLTAPSFRNAPLPSLRAMTNTGGRLSVSSVRALRECQPQADLFLMYGLTEAFRATYLPPALVDEHPDSIGRAIPGSDIMVLRDDLTPCAPGEVGELVQRGSTVAAGYWNDADATGRVFRANPLRPDGAPANERVVFSGDLVRQDAEGLLYFVGRRDSLVKTLGYRVSPDEIADVLYASGDVVEAVVGTQPDSARGESIVAWVVLSDTGSAEHMRRFCGAELPRYLQPARIEVRDSLPRTSSGKFDVRQLQLAEA